MRVKLHNIQGHKNSVFQIHGGLNVIVGSTDSGKSTIIRALRWLVFNKPAGDSLMRNGASKMYVEVTTDEGDIVRRERGTVNSYSINGQVLKAFGAGVPEQVTTILNLTIHNFKFQHDPFFLLSDSGPERARVLNKFLNLNRMTATCKTSAGHLREERARLRFLREEEDKVKDQIEIQKPMFKAANKTLLYIGQAIENEKIIKHHAKVALLVSEYKGLVNAGIRLSEQSDSLSDGLTKCERLFVRVKRFNVVKDHLAGLKRLKEIGDRLCKEETAIQEKINKLDLERCSECGRIK